MEVHSILCIINQIVDLLSTMSAPHAFDLSRIELEATVVSGEQTRADDAMKF